MDNSKLFRKESMDRISSPEQLHDYMRVTTPRLWMLLAAILVLAAGFVIYACTATMESTMPLTVQAEYGGILSVNLPISQLDLIKLRMPFRVEDRTGFISDIYQVTVLRFDMVFDGNAFPEDGFYEMTFVDKDGLPETVASSEYFLSVNGGVITSISLDPSLADAFRTERRIRLEGKLATVTSAEPYDMVTVSFALDDPSVPMPDGTYRAELITETTTPISFLLN